MARTKQSRKFRLKLTGIAVLALAAGIGLITLSFVVTPDNEQSEATATAPVTPADQPADQPTGPAQRQSSAQNLGGLLLLFGSAGILLCVVCIGWLIVDIRNSRPAWKRQQKYPRRK
jgi:hypothetical protein